MDIDKINKETPQLGLDLLATWASDCFGREAQVASSGWHALAEALNHSRILKCQQQQQPQQHQLQFDGCDQVSEASLRRQLVFVYRAQPETAIKQILEAKLKDSTSFFHAAGYLLEEAYQYWTWYLYCLTFLPSELSAEANPDVVSMPLDMIDVQVFSWANRHQITVTRLAEEAARIQPYVSGGGATAEAEGHIILLRHKGFWAALLGDRPPSKEPTPLIGAVVELGEIPPGPLQAANNRSAFIYGYDSSLSCYIACVNRVTFPVERSCIRKVVFHEQFLQEGEALATRWGGREERITPLSGIPDGSFEWALLHELVRRVGRNRLAATQQELSGHDAGGAAGTRGGAGVPRRIALKPLPVPSLADVGVSNSGFVEASTTCSATSSTSTTENSNASRETTRQPTPQQRLPMHDAERLLSQKKVLYAMALKTYRPTSPNGTQLAVEMGNEVQLTHASADWLYGENSSRRGAKGWCLRSALTVWEVISRFEPKPDWPPARYLSVEEGQVVTIIHRYDGDWTGWCFVKIWGEDGEGMLHTACLREVLFLSRRVDPLGS